AVRYNRHFTAYGIRCQAFFEKKSEKFFGVRESGFTARKKADQEENSKNFTAEDAESAGYKF
ncbi:MAG: hypothetical protein PVH19_14760, partial [Planctomycetia bacterium]